jgi:hypothetical protein
MHSPNWQLIIWPERAFQRIGVSLRNGFGQVVMKYLDSHPEKLHVLATNLILVALREAYPCKD